MSLGLCPICNQKKIIFYNGLCQTCYRKGTKEKKAKTTYINTYTGDSKNIKIICSLFCSGKYTKKEIAEKLDMNYNTVRVYTLRYCKVGATNDIKE